MKRLALDAGALALVASLVAISHPALAATAYITNEKGNSISVMTSTNSRSCAPSRWAKGRAELR
jgi:hypothetical protein